MLMRYFLLALLFLAPPAVALVLPPEGIDLNAIHAQFEWLSVADVDEYQLQVVVDDGSPDPFALATPVVDATVGAAQPRSVVTSGLGWGAAYAWRVRGIDTGSPLSWGAIHRFTTAALPAGLPAFIVTTGVGTPEPGLTLFNLNFDVDSVSNHFAIVIDAAGNLVWFLKREHRFGDVRLLPSGRILAVGGGRAWEFVLSGPVSWVSPDDPDLHVHHEAFPMPNGNVMVAVFTYQEVMRNSELQLWKGDRFVEIDRATGAEVWSWNTFDYLSTLDFDDTQMAQPNSPGEGDPDSYPWTHSNAVIYNAADDSVYASLRHLSRVIRIDYATGDIVYQMGMGPPSMPSGDVDFGDNLFSYQHAPELLPNGNMVLYDNGDRRDQVDQTTETGVTKAIELSFTGTPPSSATIAWQYTLPGYTPALGDADRQPGGNTLVAAGWEGKVIEVDASGTMVWQLEVPGVRIYRAERIPELILDVPGDTDSDSVADFVDNCPDQPNLPQTDTDEDARGDVCDDDDDGDGLLDAVETNTGIYVSPTDTGTDPLLADTDGDGFDDAEELQAGTDPNDASSFPPPALPALPALSNRGIAVLLVLLALTGASRLRRDSFSRA